MKRETMFEVAVKLNVMKCNLNNFPSSTPQQLDSYPQKSAFGFHPKNFKVLHEMRK